MTHAPDLRNDSAEPDVPRKPMPGPLRDNLYVELASDNWTWGQSKLRASCNALVDRYPRIAEAAKEAGTSVDQYLLDTVLAHHMPAQVALASLTLHRDSDINVAVRVSGDHRPGWPLPRGVALVARGTWKLFLREGQPSRFPRVQIFSFHDGPVGPARQFEAALDITCMQIARMGQRPWFERNVLTPELAESLPHISDVTSEKLRDWTAFLDWKRRLVQASRGGLRYTSRKLGGDERSVEFTIVGPSQGELNSIYARIPRDSGLVAIDVAASEDRWVLNLPETARDPRSGEIGSRIGRAPEHTQSATDPVGCPWSEPAQATIRCSFSDDAMTAIDRHDDPKTAAERALSKIPAEGFVVPSSVQDVSQIDRHARALEELGNQGGYSPYLARYIFDAAEAREPSELVAIDSWFNPHLNDAQRRAVQKIVSAPDLSLIQGPPGTGKTTVIAESIAQMALLNQKVLLASQTHTAVDNALSRLPSHPSIRAVRLTRNVDRVSDDGQEFVNQRALSRYYNALADAVEQRRREAVVSSEVIRTHAATLRANQQHLTALENAESAIAQWLTRRTQSAKAHRSSLAKFGELGIRLPVAVSKATGVEQRTEADRWADGFRRDMPALQAFLDGPIDGPVSTARAPESQGVVRLKAEQADLAARINDDSAVIPRLQEIARALEVLEGNSRRGVSGPSLLKKYVEDPSEALTPPRAGLLGLLKKDSRPGARRTLLGALRQAERALTDLEKASTNWSDCDRELADATPSRDRAVESAQKYLDEHPELKSARKLPSSKPAIAFRELSVKYEEDHADAIAIATARTKDLEDWGDIQDDWATDLTQGDAAERDWDAIGDEWLETCNVVGVTCNENPRTLDEPGLTNFDLAIVDEVSKATPLELLLPLMRAQRSALVGDHRQLPPMFREGQDAESIGDEADEDVPEELALTKENVHKYEKFVTASLFRTHYERAPESMKERLTVQHRMHPDIMDAVNRFYEGQLTCGIDDPDKARAHGVAVHGAASLAVVAADQHVVWVDTTYDDRGSPYREPRPGSGEERTNRLEAQLIVRMLRQMDDALSESPDFVGKHKEVGIVSMYQAQARLIRSEIRKAKQVRPFLVIKEEVNTVVKYQGKEKPIILVSMVRNFGPQASRRRRDSRANVARFEYINVAFSRAQELLVVFGARDTFDPYEVELPPMDASGTPVTIGVYREITDVIERRGALKQAAALGELPAPDGGPRR